MTKELSKAIMDRSRIKNKYLKWPSRENFLEFKKIKNLCKKLTIKAKKHYFSSFSTKNVTSNKSFWDAVKPFFSNKNTDSHDAITIKHNDKLVDNEEELAELFNSFFINAVENTVGKAPTSLGDSSKPESDVSNVKCIINEYKNHPAILKIKEVFDENEVFNLPKADPSDINKIIKSLNSKKATGADGIPPKLVKTAANIIDVHLTNILNNDISRARFPEEAKIANVRPIYKKDKRDELKNYRPVSILNTFSKIYEKFIQESITPFVETFLSKFISAYRKTYGTNHVLLRLIEEWKLALDKGKFVGAVLMDLSKAFDCIPHDLLIAKLHAYGCSEDSLVFFYSY